MQCIGMPLVVRASPRLARHFRKHHGEIGPSTEQLESIHEVHAQALKKKRGERVLFEVHECTESVSKATSDDILGDELRVALETYSIKMRQYTASEGQDNREESPFVFIAQPANRPEHHRLTMEEAAHLAGGVKEMDGLGFFTFSCASLSASVRNTLL